MKMDVIQKNHTIRKKRILIGKEFTLTKENVRSFYKKEQTTLNSSTTIKIKPKLRSKINERLPISK